MKYTFLLGALLLPGCIVDDSMSEVTCLSSAVAQKDGVLLATYRISPTRFIVGDQFRFIFKEAFVMRRLMMNASGSRRRIIDSTAVNPKLILVGTDDSELGVLRAGVDIEILDSASIKQYGYGLKGSQPFDPAFDFNLNPVETFRCPDFRLKLTVRDEQGENKVFFLKATPLRCAPSNSQTLGGAL